MVKSDTESRATDVMGCLAAFGGVLVFLSALLVPAASSAQVLESDTGVELGAAYTAEFWGNVSGGLERGVRYMDNIDLTAEADLQVLAGWRNAGFFIYGMGNQGGSISALAGDLQGISNIEAETSWRIYEAWIEQLFPGAGISLLGGLYDINSEFNVLPSTLLFINSSHGIGPAMSSSGVLGPSIFPYTSLGARLKVRLAQGLYLMAAGVDGVPSNPASTDGTKIYLRPDDGLLLTGELALLGGAGEVRPRTSHMLGRNGEADIPWKVAVGGWIYTKKRHRFAATPGNTEDDDKGLYVIAEAKLISGREPGSGLSLFGRLEMANGEVNPVTGYLGAGAVYRGLFRDGAADQAGFAVAHALRSGSYSMFLEDGPFYLTDTEAETNFELTYLTAVGDHLELQFDSQYILNPGWYGEIPPAWVNALRVIVSI